MEILRSLGVNSTLFIHLACFLISYVALTQLILKPYGAALRERVKRTVGSEESAVRMLEEANELNTAYEVKARQINGEIKAQYDSSRTAAMKEYDRLVEAARSEAAAAIEGSRKEISAAVKTAQAALSAEVPAVGVVIASKLAGKEMSL